MRRYLLVPLALFVLSTSPPVRAADPTVSDCLTATEGALKLRNDHRLRKAKEQLLVCAAASCPAMVRSDCTHGIDEVTAALPTVVFTVKSGEGQELPAVKVTMDGEAVTDHLDGSALALDPGSHELTFIAVGEAPVTRTFILHENEKGRRETIVVGRPAAPAMPTAVPAPAPSVVAAPPVAPSPAPSAAASPATSDDSGSGRRVLGLVLGGAGVAGLAVGGIFGALAASAWSTAQNECPTHTGCSAQAMSEHNNVTTFGTISTAGLVAGGVLLAGGVTLFLTAPKASAPAVGLQLTPRGFAVTGGF